MLRSKTASGGRPPPGSGVSTTLQNSPPNFGNMRVQTAEAHGHNTLITNRFGRHWCAPRRELKCFPTFAARFCRSVTGGQSKRERHGTQRTRRGVPTTANQHTTAQPGRPRGRPITSHDYHCRRRNPPPPAIYYTRHTHTRARGAAANYCSIQRSKASRRARCPPAVTAAGQPCQPHHPHRTGGGTARTAACLPEERTRTRPL